MRIRRICTAVLTVGVLASTTLAPANADDVTDQKQKIDSSAEKLRGALDETSKEYAAAALRVQRVEAQLPSAESALASARGRLAAAQARVEQLQSELTKARAAVDAAEAEIARINAHIDATKRTLGLVARDAYQRGGTTTELAVALEAETPRDFATGMVMVRSVMRTENATVDGLASDRAEMAAKRADLQANSDRIRVLTAQAKDQLEEVQRLEQEAEAARNQVAALLAQAEAAKADVASEKAAEEQRLAAMEAESRKLQAILVERARQERARAARSAQRAAAAAAASAARSPSAGGSTSSGASTSSGGSRSSGGSTTTLSRGGILHYPIPNSWITSPYGMRLHPVTHIYKLHDGTDFHAACGTPIHAAASGRVIWATYKTGYGYQLAIDHGIINGHDIVTSYSHQPAGGFAASVGQHVSTGDVIGHVGDTGFVTACHLHFMVYVDGHTTDPMGWL